MYYAQIAQLVEQETENLRVLGSIPSLGTIQEAEMPLFIIVFFRSVTVTAGSGDLQVGDLHIS